MLFALMPDSWHPVKSPPDRIVFPARGLYAACKVVLVAPRCKPDAVTRVIPDMFRAAP